ncbi:FHA domain-containing protein [Candidatus Leptofilum sp.]|uniref:FHA domain-containing protein n=1 Tax=Candidatus Leptofilum sp. TaxID=3241576 RepID=UPI003B59E468
MADTLYQLTVRKGPKVGETFLLETLSLTVGRDPVSDIILNDPEVSRQHARFTQTDAGYQVQDLGSTNGTFVNGQRLESEPVDLEPGFTISMGSGVTLLYELVPTGDNLAATIVDSSGLRDALDLDQASGLDEVDDALAAEMPNMPNLDEDPPIPSDWEPDPSPPFPVPSAEVPAPPPMPPATAPLVPPSDEDEAAKQRRRNTIIAVTAVILLLCCCGFLIFMWQYGGDWLLEALGLL